MSRPDTGSDNHLALVQALWEAWHAFQGYAGADIRHSGLSAPQFEVLSALGGAERLTFTELGEQTLIYKTTLTGVVDRLESKKLVSRRPCDRDRRCVYVCLTDEGRELHQRLAPSHSAHLLQRLGDLDRHEHEQAIHTLNRLRDLFRKDE